MVHYLSVGDETGTVHVLEIPKHLITTYREEVNEREMDTNLNKSPIVFSRLSR